MKTKEEYDKYFQSEEYSRRMALIAKGAANAKKASAKKKGVSRNEEQSVTFYRLEIGDYEKYQTPDEWELRKKLVMTGIENEKRANARKRRIIEAKMRAKRREEVAERYDV